ncbi:hypothetical protein [Desulfofustis glycolicus]|uniref:hypothetical protein n=1 Tax=Desulfofustis glycolicus TaxID=51195 RepID=UPI0011614DEF|nr:hypothetical protein [Desulfofustis glycolicus]MCB2218612.1 hypothetical protein [Desulfobulbaceae bacterium]
MKTMVGGLWPELFGLVRFAWQNKDQFLVAGSDDRPLQLHEPSSGRRPNHGHTLAQSADNARGEPFGEIKLGQTVLP